MASARYYKANQKLGKGEIDLVTDDIRVLGVSSGYVRDLADEFVSDIGVDNILTRSANLENKSVSATGVFDADDVTLPGIPLGQSVSQLVLYKYVAGGGSSTAWSIAYWNSLGDVPLPIADIDMDALTHIVHWVALTNSDGTLDTASWTSGAFAAEAAAIIAAAHAAGVEVLLGLAAPYGAQMTSAVTSHLSAYISNIMSIVNTYGYDGVDIDWEGTTPDVAGLAAGLRTALGAKTLMAAATVDLYTYWGGVSSYFDRINVMTYDLMGGYIGYSWFNAPLYGPVDESAWSIELARTRFIANGVPAAKLGIGIPFYGYHSTNGGGSNVNGPRQTWTGADPTLTQVHYKDIVPLVGTGGRTRTFDSQTRTPWLVDGSGAYYTYDDAQAITEKVAYVIEKGLGGWVLFNISMDYFPGASPKNPLLAAVKAANSGSGDDANPLIGNIDAAVGMPYAGLGTDQIVRWSNGANKIMKI